SIAEKGIAAIREYFEAIDIGQEKYLFEAKLLILGEPGAGKTTLARKLKDANSSLPKPEETTWGIDVEPLEFTVDKKNIPKIAGNEYLNKVHYF
ncbi:MAG: hypothetical protein HC831_18125, partial [Chloroflexia bacterium]|nr:hypothetical protein [Chloroflexia bacterium]